MAFTITMNAQVYIEGDQENTELFTMCEEADLDLDGICDTRTTVWVFMMPAFATVLAPSRVAVVMTSPRGIAIVRAINWMRRAYVVEIARWTPMPTASVTMKMTVTAVLTNVVFAMAGRHLQLRL